MPVESELHWRMRPMQAQTPQPATVGGRLGCSKLPESRPCPHRSLAGEFPDVTWDKMLVDAMTVRMTLKPQSVDTIVATNLHADILSDLAGALAGSIGDLLDRGADAATPRRGRRGCPVNARRGSRHG